LLPTRELKVTDFAASFRDGSPDGYAAGDDASGKFRENWPMGKRSIGKSNYRRADAYAIPMAEFVALRECPSFHFLRKPVHLQN
jgi:hypothetical protein